MNLYDSAKVLGLSGVITPEITKTAYRTACKKYHPDINPAGEDMMKIVNTALNAVFALSGLMIEICGAWVWVTGDTITHKEALKGAGFLWASKKKAWYFRPEEYRSRSKGSSSLEEIRAKYGSSRPAYQTAYSLKAKDD